MKPMKAILDAAFAIVFIVASAEVASTPANAATIKASAVCKRGTSFCMGFSESGTIPPVANFTFVAPTAGTALVSFNGTMQCQNFGANDAQHGVVDISTQIVNDATPPNYQAPGGGRFAMRLVAPTTVSFSGAVNLASSRVVPLTQGSHTFSFRIARNRMDFSMSCTVFNGNFNVVFVP
jgi:hypothetical protein